MAEASFKDIPELFEVDLGESLTARTEALSTFRELGPPDLCHVVKSTGRSGQRDLGSYHYISGVDASSSASLAAYINSLTYAIEDNSAWFSKGSSWKVKNGCYCCFNAFSRVDIRVDVKIPGGVNAYAIDLRGERHEATQELWQETYVSALLRSILYSDDPNYWLDAYRKLDPITSPDSEIRFLQAAEALFMKGWQVGSDPEIQVASVVSNHLTAGIMKYFGDSGRYQPAANLFEKLVAREPEVASLLARSYIGMNEEVKAVQIMASSIRQTPSSYTLLHAQCDLLRSKGKYDWAVKLARQAVNCAPSEFVTWEKLTECWIDLGEFESALLTLNSCPMFTFNGRDVHRNLTPARVHLPFARPIGEILPDRVKTEDDEADPALLRLPAPGLRGTWARAYALLTRLVSQIGWDELLKTRSSVFVMEEEYRMQKAHGDISAATNGASGSGKVIHEDGTVRNSMISSSDSTTLGESLDDDDDASTRGMVSPHSHHESGSLDDGNGNGGVNGDAVSSSKTKIGLGLDPSGGASMNSLSSPIPTIRISTESDRDFDEDGNAAEAPSKGNVNGEAPAPATTTNGFAESRDVSELGLEKPAQAAAGAEDGGAAGDNTEKDSLHDSASSSAQAQPGAEAFSFSNKRLCERWLDNLFMVLYEDLRVWTIFRAEVAHFKTQHVAYRKTGLEWEILGDLGIRLHHKEEAKEAYQRCLDTPRYSQKPWAKLMDTYAEEGDIQRCIQTAIRVAAYQWADYTEMTFPTQIARAFFKLGQLHGHAKISYTLLSMGLPDSILKIMDSYLQYGKIFKVEGYDF
ncbi:Chs5p-Arf1p-binding proteins-domain-containing protein [Lentinula raphanica]|uniref:Chs5p-Arf1p-binding proteins-domain-containing protein n=1 Tax=Lentinula raphanica TaxID=153919 RepID=A0AA38UKD9_9AGAR|nr:Chs5p-Arf1p-binding proteins-domain-containing protein [Lentinula raphanica]KAJ3841757.1 Chs5p-Arf1p-binding proteins-domain-containing protein [Lentinula raphanica]